MCRVGLGGCFVLSLRQISPLTHKPDDAFVQARQRHLFPTKVSINQRSNQYRLPGPKPSKSEGQSLPVTFRQICAPSCIPGHTLNRELEPNSKRDGTKTRTRTMDRSKEDTTRLLIWPQTMTTEKPQASVELDLQNLQSSSVCRILPCNVAVRSMPTLGSGHPLTT